MCVSVWSCFHLCALLFARVHVCVPSGMTGASKMLQARRAEDQRAEGNAAAEGEDAKPKKRKGKSALKGGRVAAITDDDGTIDKVALLPMVFIRAALVVLTKLEGQLLAAGSMEEAFIVLKCLPPALEALATTHPKTADTLVLAPAVRVPSNLTNAREMGNDSPVLSSRTPIASTGKAVADPAPASAIAQYVRALELLDTLDDTYALTEALARDKKRMAAYPALRPNTTPSTFITVAPQAVTAHPTPAAAAGGGLTEHESVASVQSLEDLSEDAVAKLVSSASRAQLPASLSLLIPAIPPPICDYSLDDGRLMSAALSTTGGDPQPNTSPTMLSPTNLSSVAEFVCDGKLVQVWMLPRQFRFLVSVGVGGRLVHAL